LITFFPISPTHIWAIRPILPEDLSLLPQLLPADRSLFEFIHHPVKQLEMIASRLLVQKLCEHQGIVYKGIIKNAFNKPQLIDSPYCISIAHTEGWATASLHLTTSTGIDIEFPSEKIRRVTGKFLHPTEQKITQNDSEMLCKFWTAKEALYKLYARKRLDFREMIRIEPNGQHFKGIITGEYETIQADLFFFRWHQAFVTVAEPAELSPMLP